MLETLSIKCSNYCPIMMNSTKLMTNNLKILANNTEINAGHINTVDLDI